MGFVALGYDGNALLRVVSQQHLQENGASCWSMNTLLHSGINCTSHQPERGSAGASSLSRQQPGPPAACAGRAPLETYQRTQKWKTKGGLRLQASPATHCTWCLGFRGTLHGRWSLWRAKGAVGSENNVLGFAEINHVLLHHVGMEFHLTEGKATSYMWTISPTEDV